MDTMQRNQPVRGPSQPDDTRNYSAGSIFSLVGGIFVNGFPFLARMKTSLRVGSGTGLSVFDGTDGAIVANGAAAALVSGSRTAPNGGNYLSWLHDGTNLDFGTQAGQLWVISPSTGFIAQTAWTSATLGNSWTNLSPHTARYRLLLPTGQVEVQGMITAGTYGSAAFTLPSNMRPTQELDFGSTVWSGAAWQTTSNPVAVTTAGLVIVTTGTAGHSTSINFTFSI